MSEQVLIAIFLLIAAAIVTIGGILWRHMVSCSKDVAIPLAQLVERVTAVQKEIGDHETGIIGQLHRYGKDLAILNDRLKK
jgi:hypothetical protein